jgi:hypothetical protein
LLFGSDHKLAVTQKLSESNKIILFCYLYTEGVAGLSPAARTQPELCFTSLPELTTGSVDQ